MPFDCSYRATPRGQNRPRRLVRHFSYIFSLPSLGETPIVIKAALRDQGTISHSTIEPSARLFALVKSISGGEPCLFLVDKDLDFDLRLQFFVSHSHRGGALKTFRELQAITKEVAGIHVLLTRSLFASDILRRFPEHVALTKSTSAPLRC